MRALISEKKKYRLPDRNSNAQFSTAHCMFTINKFEPRFNLFPQPRYLRFFQINNLFYSKSRSFASHLIPLTQSPTSYSFYRRALRPSINTLGSILSSAFGDAACRHFKLATRAGHYTKSYMILQINDGNDVDVRGVLCALNADRRSVVIIDTRRFAVYNANANCCRRVCRCAL